MKVRVNTKAFASSLVRTKGNMRFAMVVSMTRSAKATRDDLKTAMPTVFDRPTRFTRNSLEARPARKDNLRAAVGLKYFFGGGGDYHYLTPQAFGGQRKPKPYEKRLFATGILPAGMYTVPGAGARLNSFGNITAGQIKAMLSDLGASSDWTQNRTTRSTKRNKSYARRRWFVVREGQGLAPGIWIRQGRKIRPYLLFVSRTQYRKRWHFFTLGRKYFGRHMQDEYGKAIEQYVKPKQIRNAKPLNFG